MTNMEILELFGEARSKYVVETQTLRDNKNVVGKKQISTRKLWILIAAVIAVLALSITAYAAIIARIRLQMTQAEEIKPEEKAALCSIYPQNIPDGYQLINGYTNSANVRELYYWKELGAEIVYRLSIQQDLRDIPLDPSGGKKDVTISGNPAILYQMDSTRWVLWENSAAGYTAFIQTNDAEVDILAMAESVCVGEPMPESFGNGVDDETNGLWYPQWAPEGYRIYDVSPASDGSQSIEFMRMDENGEIHLIQYVVSISRDLSNIGQAPHSTMNWKDVDVAGLPGRMVTIGDYQKILFWENEAEDFNAMLMTEEMDADLVAIASSVGPGEKLEISPIYTQNPEYSVQMEQENTYVAFEPWYPQTIPEGYEIYFVSDKTYGEQTIQYANAEGDHIQYILYYRMGSWPRGYEGDLEPEEVSINGMTGYLIRNQEAQSLLWVNEEKGFGFVLKTGADIDILEMARSVAPGPELPATNAGKTDEALKQLGDYRITALPEGMREEGVAGWPKENPDDWYSYVRRRYVCPADNREVGMEYSTYVSQDASVQEVACMIVGTNAKPIQLSGYTGAYSEYEGHTTVVWINESSGLAFKLFSDDFSASDLIAVAQSVQKVTD